MKFDTGKDGTNIIMYYSLRFFDVSQRRHGRAIDHLFDSDSGVLNSELSVSRFRIKSPDQLALRQESSRGGHGTRRRPAERTKNHPSSTYLSTYYKET